MIPRHELDDFARLPEDCRTEVRARLRVMQRLAAISRGIQAAIAEQAAAAGISPKTLRRQWDAWRHTRDWRTLIDRRRFPEAEDRGILPEPIIELWKQLCERNQRKCKPAYRELLRLWRAGQPAGLDWPERDPLTDLPRGCTYRNLMRYAPTKYELTLARIGRGAASAMLPKVLSTRVGLEVGQVFILDDQDYDVQVAFVGVNRKMTRPSGFNALDFGSACEVLQGYKPTVLNSDGTKQKLRQVDYQWFLVNLLTTIGYRADTGTLLIGEHGTSNAGRDFEERVALATRDLVRFDASGIHGEQMAGLFRGQPRGNPRYKAARESWFNLLRNEMAALPGPTGMDRAHAPEETYGLDKYVRDILDAIADRPDLAEKLALPVLRWPDFVRLTSLIVQRINDRAEHELEGWSDRLADEWRLSLDLPWTPAASYLALPAPQRTLADAVIAQTPGLWRTRRLSPWEVWSTGRRALTRVDGPMIPVLLGTAAARPVRVRDDHQIVIEDGEIELEPMWFDAALTNGRILAQREEVLAWLNPFDPQALQVGDLHGRFLGTAPRVQRIGRLDVDNLRARYGRVRAIEAQLLTPVAARGATKARERIAMHQDNARTLGASNTERDRADGLPAASRGRRASDTDFDEIAGSAVPPAPEPQPEPQPDHHAADAVFDL